MTYSPLNLRREALGRPPDWRWHLASMIARGANHPVVLSAADLWVAQARTLIDDLQHGHEESISDLTALGAAHAIYSARDQQWRWEIEARLLTDAPLEEVADLCSIKRDVLAAYHEVFFHVRDRLKGTSYIPNTVIGPKLHDGMSETDVGVLLKVAAWRGRGPFLEQMIRYFRDKECAAGASYASDPSVLERRRDQLMIRKWVLCQVCPANEVALVASTIMKSIDGLVELPVPGEEIAAEALSVRLQIVERGLDQLSNLMPGKPSRDDVGSRRDHSRGRQGRPRKTIQKVLRRPQRRE